MKCSTCKIDNPSSGFGFRNKTKGIRRKQCNACVKRTHNKWLHKNKDKYIKQVRKNNKIRNKKILQNLRIKLYQFLLDNPCVDCREGNPIVLEFDHRDPSDKKNNISKLVAHGNKWDNILKEIEKCDVVCANCHKKRTAIFQNWWKNNAPIR